MILLGNFAEICKALAAHAPVQSREAAQLLRVASLAEKHGVLRDLELNVRGEESSEDEEE